MKYRYLIIRIITYILFLLIAVAIGGAFGWLLYRNTHPAPQRTATSTSPAVQEYLNSIEAK